MIDKRSSLTILHEDNSVFSDHSHKLAAFGRDNLTLDLTAAEDNLYVGFEKPIHSFYIDIPTPDGGEGSLTLEYWNGSSWVSTFELSDDTFGLYRSGFVRWRNSEKNTISDQAENEVNGIKKFWYRLSFDTNRTVGVSGLNLVFSDDYELSLEQPFISDSEFLGSASSHIKTHAAVRREILQKFNDKDYFKYDDETGRKEDINAWDLLDIDEVRLAATYLALSKIYSQLSDNPEDVWNEKSGKYKEKYDKFINLARLSVDFNDDGIKDDAENSVTFKSRILTR